MLNLAPASLLSSRLLSGPPQDPFLLHISLINYHRGGLTPVRTSSSTVDMALVLAKAAPLKPDIKLTEALDDYGKILSDEERKQFYAQGAPDATAAINLATLIDGECNRRRRQCMGPRLITFLESVQQFSGVVDTFVSSHPAIAALVWGGVKIALQIANNFTSYFDRLSTLLMNLGRQCPRIHELGSLYPSNGLQKALCDYYAAIVRLCKHSTQRLRKSGMRTFRSSFHLCFYAVQGFDRYPAYSRPFEGLLVSFEKEFGPYEREIAQLAQEVKFEASLASKQAQKLESELQARERSEARKRGLVLFQLRDSVHQRNKEDKDLRMEIDRRSLRKRKLQALDSLSTYDYQKTYKQSRKQCVPGTSNWILKNSEFQMWREGAPKGLWCSGKCKYTALLGTLWTLMMGNSGVREDSHKVRWLGILRC